LEEAKG
jgi:hypothetical protein